MLPIDKTMGIGILKTSRIHLIDKSHVEIIVMHYIRYSTTFLYNCLFATIQAAEEVYDLLTF